MSTVHMAVENITDNFDYDGEGIRTKVYSVIDNMNFYQVEVRDGVEYEAYDSNMNVVDGDLGYTLIEQVTEFEKGE